MTPRWTRRRNRRPMSQAGEPIRKSSQIGTAAATAHPLDPIRAQAFGKDGKRIGESDNIRRSLT